MCCCIVLRFFDDYTLERYVEDYNIIVRNSDNITYNLFLFNSPKNNTEQCIVYQQRHSGFMEDVEYVTLSDGFQREFVEYRDNPFEYVKNNFWSRNWETKYSLLFNNNVSEMSVEYKYLYKYKMNPSDCEKLQCHSGDDSVIEGDKDATGIYCKSIEEQRRWFQEYINGKLTFSNPILFNDPFDCDCELLYDASYKTCIYLALDKNVPLKNIETALDTVKKNRFGNTDIEWNDDSITILLNEIGRICNKDREVKALRTITPELIRERIENYKKDIFSIKESVRVLCLSPHNADILMWGYYGNSGKGLCCEYEYSGLLEDVRVSANDGICIYGKVDYDDNKPEYSVKTNSKYSGLWEYVTKCMFTKYTKWTHEDEFRIVLLKNNFPNNVYLVDSNVESYYLGCKNIDDPLEKKYSFPSGKVCHQLVKDKKSYKLIER